MCVCIVCVCMYVMCMYLCMCMCYVYVYVYVYVCMRVYEGKCVGVCTYIYKCVYIHMGPQQQRGTHHAPTTTANTPGALLRWIHGTGRETPDAHIPTQTHDTAVSNKHRETPVLLYHHDT